MMRLQFGVNSGDPLTVLCLGSHCDDIEIGCGGTILRLLSGERPVDVTWVVLSSNGVRESEARIGSQLFLRQARRRDVIVRDFRNGFFPFEGAKIKDLFESLKPLAPNLILTHNRKDAHQDHRLIAELTWNTFRDHLVLEYEVPKYDGDLGQPSVFVPLDAEVCGKKVQYLMEAFQSQRAKRWFEENTFLSLMRLRGMECNAASGYAEAFYCRKLVL